MNTHGEKAEVFLFRCRQDFQKESVGLDFRKKACAISHVPAAIYIAVEVWIQLGSSEVKHFKQCPPDSAFRRGSRIYLCGFKVVVTRSLITFLASVDAFSS